MAKKMSLIYDKNFTVDFAVDINRYMGKWFEIARLPTWFEQDCDNVSADYSIAVTSANIENVRVKVCNQCKYHAKSKRVEGLARVTDPPMCSKLQVTFSSFLPWSLSGASYWILDLDRDNYSWAMVGNPQKNALWILSRTPVMDQPLFSFLRNRALAKGFDISKLILTNQDENINLYNT
jgi:apolipoprotein D and lipocalin family protein